MRRVQLIRETSETKISLELNLDGSGAVKIKTGVGLLDHFLILTAFWAKFDLQVQAVGDLYIDSHHTIEDVGLALGQAIHEALADRRGIRRVGYGRVPMDEALSEVTIDLSGRPWLVWLGDDLLPPLLGGDEKDVWREFYKSLAQGARMNLHIAMLYGKNGHHLLESVAKGLGLALAEGVRVEDEQIRSTKGILL